MGFDVAIAAVSRGACVLEKHLTLDTGLPGPDHRASIDPREFAALIRSIRRVESALGDGIKRPAALELDVRPVVVKSIVAARMIRAGRIIRRSDLCLRRASAGMPLVDLQMVVGREAKRNIATDTPLSLRDLR